MQHAHSDADVQSWLAAARNPAVRADLESIFADVATAISERAPACWASGRCCNFKDAGHKLYVTGLEAAYTATLAPSTPGAQQLNHESLAAAISRGGCPFQAANLCSVHTIKPLGCRVYFCDRSEQQWQQDLSESMLTRIRELHARYSIPYVYAEWGSLLTSLLSISNAAPA